MSDLDKIEAWLAKARVWLDAEVEAMRARLAATGDRLVAGHRPHTGPAEPGEPPHQGSSGRPVSRPDHQGTLDDIDRTRAAFAAAINRLADAGVEIGVAIRPEAAKPGGCPRVRVLTMIYELPRDA